MTDEMKKLMILLIGIAVVLLIVIILFAGKSPFRRFISLFLEEYDDDGNGAPNRVNSSHKKGNEVQKKTFEPLVELATLIRKSDDRLRVVEASGQVKLIDEYYELVFVTRKGKTLKIQCSRDAYNKIPFNQQGSLTYKRNVLVKFKYYEDTVYN